MHAKVLYGYIYIHIPGLWYVRIYIYNTRVHAFCLARARHTNILRISQDEETGFGSAHPRTSCFEEQLFSEPRETTTRNTINYCCNNTCDGRDVVASW